MRAAVFGSGAWGTALAQVLCDNSHDVTLYGPCEAEISDLRGGYNRRYFGDTPITRAMTLTSSVRELHGLYDVIVLAVPTRAFPDVYATVAPLLTEGTVVVNVAKGFEPGTGDRLSVALARAFSGCRYRGIASLIGPSHAEEVARRMLTSVAAVSDSLTLAQEVQQYFSNGYFRVYAGNDVVGAEYGVAIKNVIALASGMLVGRGYGDNAKAALITRGLAETVRYGVQKGGRRETFFGLAGVGDLIVTCFSPHSRNYQAGFLVGEADSIAPLADLNLTVEGVESCRQVHADACRAGIDMPIVSAVHSVLFEGVKPSEAICKVMSRPLRNE